MEQAQDLLEGLDYEPVASYAIIGDCRSAALVSRHGSIDWLCLPDFSSPSIFAALLDRRRGGRFLVRPRHITHVQRRYVGDSAILETCFHCRGGVLRLTDCMAHATVETTPQRLLRLAQCVEGEVEVDAVYQPRPAYARCVPRLRRDGQNAWLFHDRDGAALLQCDFPLSPVDDGTLAGRAVLRAGTSCRFLFVHGEEAGAPGPGLDSLPELLGATRRWWRDWCVQCSYQGTYAEAVMRSCMVLKLLTHRYSGAVMAALTTSLPESFTADRNWDYRFCWLRDTSLLLQSFVDLGFQDESEAFLKWLLRAGRRHRLQPLYGLDGHPVADEVILPHLEGYRGRGPVKIGNSAHRQLQLDIYGEVVQTAYRFAARGGQLNDEEKRFIVSLGDAVCRLWQRPDQSIWETRCPPRHYTYSKLMCWVALDRLLDLGRHVALPAGGMDLAAERERVRQSIESEGFNAKVGSYTGYFGGDEPDASLLLMVRYGYAGPDSERARGTLRYIMERLSADGLLYRYPPDGNYDGVEGRENLFAVCSFWAVDCLARLGEIDEAARRFEQLLGRANDLGIYAEQFDSESLDPLGNVPQAFVHSGLITAALAIDEARKGGRGVQIPT